MGKNAEHYIYSSKEVLRYDKRLAAAGEVFFGAQTVAAASTAAFDAFHAMPNELPVPLQVAVYTAAIVGGGLTTLFFDRKRRSAGKELYALEVNSLLRMYRYRKR